MRRQRPTAVAQLDQLAQLAADRLGVALGPRPRLTYGVGLDFGVRRVGGAESPVRTLDGDVRKAAERADHLGSPRRVLTRDRQLAGGDPAPVPTVLAVAVH